MSTMSGEDISSVTSPVLEELGKGKILIKGSKQGDEFGVHRDEHMSIDGV